MKKNNYYGQSWIGLSLSIFLIWRDNYEKLRKTNKGGDEKKRDGNEIY
jgi:hypothetical protein